MHIPQPKFNDTDKAFIIDALSLLIQQPSAAQAPPCTNCQQPAIERTNCSSNCENASEALSEDPVQFPIEKNIVPIVFELTTMRLVQTCWSCEGHATIDGKILKMPQISFYTEKPLYAQLISKYLSKLFWQKKLKYPWEITLSDYGQTLELTYTIKCDISCVENPDLKIMHQDLIAMGETLSTDIKSYAQELLTQLQNNIQNTSQRSTL